MKNLTDKQQIIYNFIKSEVKSKGIPPSIREICKVAKLSSTSTVHLHLSSLEKKGYIKRSHAKTRHIEVLENDFYKTSSDNFVNVPILGNVSAGIPILAIEEIEGYFPIPVQYIKNSNNFMLRIKGDSMINAGILNNDLILVNSQPSANNNEIVVALIDNEATCKRFIKKDKKFILQSENDAYEPIILDELSIIGKVIGLFRSY